MKKLLALSIVALSAAMACATAQAQETKLTFAMSGWARSPSRDRKSTRLNSSHSTLSRMPSSA